MFCLGQYVITKGTPRPGYLLPAFSLLAKFSFSHLWINHLFRVSPLQKFYIQRMFIKVLFMNKNADYKFWNFLKFDCKWWNFSIWSGYWKIQSKYWWQSVLLVCKSVVIEPFWRQTLRSKSETLFTWCLICKFKVRKRFNILKVRPI